MSYDLYFQADAIDFAQIEHYFSNRLNYKVANQQAWYSNEKTGVYFYFEWNEPKESGKSDGDIEIEHPIAFNLNYFRPHVFALEAEPEIAAFVSEFNLSIEDPQNDGMEGTAYSKDGFLRAWNAGNKFAYQTMGNSPSVVAARSLSMPSSVIEKCWSWNLDLPRLQEKLTDHVFVPTIMFAAHKNQMKTLVCWTDAIPIALPEVDLILLNRDQIAKKKMMIFKSSSMALVQYESIKPLVEKFPQEQGALPYLLLSYQHPPANVIDFFNKQATLTDAISIIPLDQILEKELTE